ncbi:hypothetical protein OIU79_028506 [Salix purpurea]|uniref:Uncharacterized protein n=1 Tax=Salix purpurea TaxID=77065 RepID=A0A9Q0VW52_SALPP|nr:hypothetical protein OIU79_028506 [Salix purpurea]
MYRTPLSSHFYPSEESDSFPFHHLVWRMTQYCYSRPPFSIHVYNPACRYHPSTGCTSSIKISLDSGVVALSDEPFMLYEEDGQCRTSDPNKDSDVGDIDLDFVYSTFGSRKV